MRCINCKMREQALDSCPDCDPVAALDRDYFVHAPDEAHIRDVILRIWNRCDHGSVLSFEPNVRKLEIVTIDGTPVAFGDPNEENKLVLVTKADARKLAPLSEADRLGRFDPRLIALVDGGWAE